MAKGKRLLALLVLHQQMDADDLAAYLDMKYITLYQKLKGTNRFSIEEAVAIAKLLPEEFKTVEDIKKLLPENL